MELIPNSTFRIVAAPTARKGFDAGVYRVVLEEIKADLVCAALIHDEADHPASAIGRTKLPDSDLKRPRKAAPKRLIGKLFWMDRSELLSLEKQGHLIPFTVAPRHIQTDHTAPTPSNRLYLAAIRKMQLFLDFEQMRESILLHRALGALVRETVEQHNVSKSYVYKQWSRLLRWGFHESSLYPDLRLCGAPGRRRPCDPPKDGLATRKKSGRKSLDETIARKYGYVIEPVQPGMSSDWGTRVRIADEAIPNPKPRWPARHLKIVTSGFLGRAAEIDGKFSLVMPQLGEYPNPAQVKHALQYEKTRLHRLISKTTKWHFNSQLRGLHGRSWQGVAGPGHTWAIDSTVGDIYLRSSINRCWIVGRPIVYIIVDVWSTAIVGFYVCLSGPSWSTAKVALFNSCASPDLFHRIYDISPIASLYPLSSLCYKLLCDRGEYLSQGHRQTSLKLDYDVDFTPPYRGDLKGLVEVLHRIEKDAQFLFIPGAIDFRRDEMDLRKVDPSTATMTLQEYVAFLTTLFTEYNFTADRTTKLDADMIAARVFPSPAGLWQFGHAAGCAFRRATDPDVLKSELLPMSTARVSRTGIRFADNYYHAPAVNNLDWSATARNFGGWDVPCHYHPGSMRSIWIPHPSEGALMQLDLTSESRSYQHNYFDEWLDAVASVKRNRAQTEHERLAFKLQSKLVMDGIVEQATRITEEAEKTASGARPTFTEARVMEVNRYELPHKTEAQTRDALRDEMAKVHDALMADMLSGKDL